MAHHTAGGRHGDDHAAMVALEKAVQLVHKAQWSDALETLIQLTTNHPLFLRGWSQLAATYIGLNQYADALRAASYVVQRDPSSVPAHVNAGIAARALNDYRAARAYLEQAITLAPRDPIAHHQLALTFSSIGSHSEAALHAILAIAHACIEPPERVEAILTRNIAMLACIPAPARRTLDDISRVFTDACTAIEGGHGARAYAQLERIRDEPHTHEHQLVASILLQRLWAQPKRRARTQDGATIIRLDTRHRNRPR